MLVQGASPLALIAQLCCSIDQPAQSQTTKNITDMHRAPRPLSFIDQSTVTDLASFQRETKDFRSGNQVRSSTLRQLNLYRGRRRSDVQSRRSIDIVNRHLASSLSSAAALDFYFRSLSRARSLATDHDFRYRASAVGGPRAFPMYSGIARPRAVRLMPGFSAVFSPRSAIVGRTAVVGQHLCQCRFGQFRQPYVSDVSLPLNLSWTTSSAEFAPLSCNCADKRLAEVTLSHDSALHWNPFSLVRLRSLPWQPGY